MATYKSNIEKLKANASSISKQLIQNSRQTIRNINKREKENIDNIDKATELLVGNPVEAYKAGYQGNQYQREGQGIIPT